MLNLEDRVLELERKLRLQRRLSRVTWTLLAALCLTSATSIPQDTGPQELKANRLEILDKTGRPVVVLAAGDKGGQVWLTTVDGVPVASLYAEEEGGALALRGKNNAPVVTAWAGQHGGNVEVRDSAARRRGWLGMVKAGARVALLDSDGKLTATLPLTPAAAAVVRGPEAYRGSATGHWVRSKDNRGNIITLEDGSVWEISATSRFDTLLWMTMDEITVVANTRVVDEFNYLLINANGDKAEAKLLTQR